MLGIDDREVDDPYGYDNTGIGVNRCLDTQDWPVMSATTSGSYEMESAKAGKRGRMKKYMEAQEKYNEAK